MAENRSKQNQSEADQNNRNDQVELDKNQSLQDPGSLVADYGRAEQNLHEQERKSDLDSRQENSSISMDEEADQGHS